MESFGLTVIILTIVCLSDNSHVKPSRRIQGGKRLLPLDNDRPGFMARIVIEPVTFVELTLKKRLCGGTIVHPYYVLSAAQCFYKFEIKNSDTPYIVQNEDIQVYLGSVYHDKGIIHEVKEFHTHPKYNDEFKNYDIALLKTVKINFTRSPSLITHMSPVWLFGDRDHNFDRFTNMDIYGWGITDLGNNRTLSALLKKMEVLYIDQDFCELIGGKRVSEAEMCADSRFNTSFCFGDTGGPLLVEDEQIGIISRPYNNDKECRYHPNIYTIVGKAKNWLNRITKINLFKWVPENCYVDEEYVSRVTICEKF